METNRQDPPVKEKEERLKSKLWELSSLGMEFAFIIMLFIYLGKSADDYFHISPWGIISGCFGGFIIALYYLIYRTNKQNIE
ncbi:MAG: AtpZ/AtpI family protein [Spirochaetota bacterium]